MISQIERFETWRKTLRPTKAGFVASVMDDVSPVIEEHGLIRLQNYGGRFSRLLVNCAAWQSRSQSDWLTVELQFSRGGSITVNCNFSWLPEKCFERTLKGPVVIDREEGSVTNAPVFFTLCKGQAGMGYPCSFGCESWSLFKSIRLAREIRQLRERVLWLLSRVERGPPTEWVRSQSPMFAIDVMRRPLLNWNGNKWVAANNGS